MSIDARYYYDKGTGTYLKKVEDTVGYYALVWYDLSWFYVGTLDELVLREITKEEMCRALSEEVANRVNDGAWAMTVAKNGLSTLSEVYVEARQETARRYSYVMEQYSYLVYDRITPIANVFNEEDAKRIVDSLNG